MYILFRKSNPTEIIYVLLFILGQLGRFKGFVAK